MTALLTVDYQGLQLWRTDQDPIFSPAFVTIDGKQGCFGEAARAQVKLKPTTTEFEFWDQFGLDRLLRRNRLATTQADLAFLHLQDFWRDVGDTDGLLLATPADFDRQQLGLLLGMAQRLSIPVTAVVNRAIAQAVPSPGDHLYHVDWHANRLILTELKQGHILSLGAQTVAQELGLNRFREAWSMALADAFVNATRLDPLHNAAVEQQLFDRLFDWLAQSEHEITAEVTHDGQGYRAVVPPSTMTRASERLVNLLLELVNDQVTAPATLLVPPQMLSLPPIRAGLEQLPGVELLPTNATSTFALQVDPDDGATPYIASRPWLDETTERQHAGVLQGFGQMAPTHVLHDGVASRLSDGFRIAANSGAELSLRRLDARSQLEFSINGDAVRLSRSSDTTLKLNGQLAAGQTVSLVAGDRVRVGERGVELQLIVVRD